MAKRSFLPSALEPPQLGDALLDTEHPSRTLIEQTYATLREDIVEGRLPPSSKLRIEHLRTQYAVGAGTVREALTRLVSDALVTTRCASAALALSARQTRSVCTCGPSANGTRTRSSAMKSTG